MPLVLQNLAYAYPGGPRVLDGVSALVRPGAVTALAGPNGSGKSTLLRLMLGTLSPTAGEVGLDGAPADRLAPDHRAARIAYLPQRPALAADFTLREAVELGRLRRPAGAGPVDRALHAVQLAQHADRRFDTLSVGQQQLGMLARALAQHDDDDRDRTAPCVLLADEPTAALDPRHALLSTRLLRARARRGDAVVVVLHDLTLARRLADDALLLRDGRLLAHGPAEAVLCPKPLSEAFGVEFRELPDPAAGPPALVPVDPHADTPPETVSPALPAPPGRRPAPSRPAPGPADAPTVDR